MLSLYKQSHVSDWGEEGGGLTLVDRYKDVQLTTFYLVEEVDDLGENVEASSRIDGGLVEDTRL